MNSIEKILTFIIIDIVLLWIFVRYFFVPKLFSNPDFFSIKSLVILLTLVNIIIYLIAYFLKKTKFKNIFLLNIFFVPIIFLFVFLKANENYYSNNFIKRKFKYNHSEYLVFINKKKDIFVIIASENPNKKNQILAGNIEIINDKIILKMDNKKYIIENDSIKGFEGKNFSLK